MTTKDKKKLEPIIESTRYKLASVGYKGALIIGKDVREIRECIKNTWVGLLADADIAEVKNALKWIEENEFKRKKAKAENPTQLYLFADGN